VMTSLLTEAAVTWTLETADAFSFMYVSLRAFQHLVDVVFPLATPSRHHRDERSAISDIYVFVTTALRLSKNS